MRIAVYHNQPSGGARRALTGFGAELARRHRVDVYTLTSADQELISDRSWATSVRVLPFAHRRPVRMGFLLNDWLRWRSFDDLDRVNAEVASLIDAGDYDAVLVDACRYTYAPAVLRHLRTPAAHYCHHGPWRIDGIDTGRARTAYEEARRLVHLPLERRIEARIRGSDRAAVRAAGLVLVNSAYTQERVRAEYGVEAVVCPPGVDLPPPDGGRREHGSYVLTVGELEPHKGHHLLLEAIGSMAAPARPALHIVANAGGASYRRWLVSRARALGVELWIGWRLSDQELGREYRRALAFVYAARHEPLGLAPLEAMAQGLAVVAIGEGGVRETVVDGRTGMLVAAPGPDLTRALSDILGDPGRCERMGQEGRGEVERRWTWPARAAALERALVDLASQRVGARLASLGPTHSAEVPA